ncbi:MAG: type II toxin-antitoxin system ParD family antitoxin [Pyrinomonadaceae bacterium]
MQISLTPELEELVNEKVASGLYDDASEVVRDALRLMDRQDAVYKLKLERLRELLIQGGEQSGDFTVPWRTYSMKSAPRGVCRCAGGFGRLNPGGARP